MDNFGLIGKAGNQNYVKLKAVRVRGNVCGEFVEFSMTQVYENKGNEDIEAVYTFPIPDTAVITGFEATLGGRTLTARVDDKNETVKLYEEAVEKGLNTLSIDQPEPSVFRITIGKILPSETVKIKITYMDQMIYEDGCLKLVIPTVVGPRNINDKDAGLAFEDEEVYKFSLSLLVEYLTKISIKSPSHDIKVEYDEGNLAKVTLQSEDQYLDNDFILLFKDEDHIEYSGMIYEYKEEDNLKGILYLRLVPELEGEEDLPQNYLFLADISKSMEGVKIQELKNALQLCIRNLSEGDHFNIVAFGDKLYYFSESGKVLINEETLSNASIFIENLKPCGEGELFEAVKYSLSENSGKEDDTILLFTDDQAENEQEILDYVKENIDNCRIFPIGIDTYTNSYFINKLAEYGYGRPEFINPGERIGEMILRQFNRITNPQVDITEINWGNMKVERTYPRTIDYLYDREPFSIFAKVSGEVEGVVTIKGRVGKHNFERSINLDTLDLEENASLIKKVWGRKRIESIEERMSSERGEVAEAMRNKIIELSKEFGILSSQTSYTMIERMEEPVLGILMNRIIPLKISEETLKNIAEGYFLESPSFLYRDPKIDLSYSRINILKTLARHQFADGGFANLGNTRIREELKITASAVLAFTLGKEDIWIYINQVNKAIRFMLNILRDDEEFMQFNEKDKKLIMLSFNAALNKGVVKGNLKQTLEEELSQKLYYRLEEIRDHVLTAIDVNESIEKIEERVKFLPENEAILDIAILGILKAF